MTTERDRQSGSNKHRKRRRDRTQRSADIVISRSLIYRGGKKSRVTHQLPLVAKPHSRALLLLAPVLPGSGAVTVLSDPAFPPASVSESVLSGVCDVDVLDDDDPAEAVT